MIFVDTNILIDFSHGKDEILTPHLDDSSKNTLCINPIVVAEFVNNQEIKTPVQKKEALTFLQLFSCVPITFETGNKAGELIRTKKVQVLADALIAATCLIHNIKLLTRNQKHFKQVEGLSLLP